MSTAFRRAEPDDIREVCALIADLHRKLRGAYPTMPICGEDIALTARHIIHFGVCLLGHGAVAGGELVHWVFNRQIIVGNVIFWNFTKPSGAAILDAIADEFTRLGATHIGVSSHHPELRLNEFYGKRGFVPIEDQFIKLLPKARYDGKS